MTKHSLKIVIGAVALTILCTATPSLAAGGSQDNRSHSAASWDTVLDFLGVWLDAVFTFDPSVDNSTQTDSGVEHGPDVDPNGEPVPEGDPTDGGSEGSNPGIESGPDVDPNG